MTTPGSASQSQSKSTYMIFKQPPGHTPHHKPPHTTSYNHHRISHFAIVFTHTSVGLEAAVLVLEGVLSALLVLASAIGELKHLYLLVEPVLVLFQRILNYAQPLQIDTLLLPQFLDLLPKQKLCVFLEADLISACALAVPAPLVFEQVGDNLVRGLELRLQFFVLQVDLFGRPGDQLAQVLEKGLADIETLHQVPQQQPCVGLTLAAAPAIAVSALSPLSPRFFGSHLCVRLGLDDGKALRWAKKQCGEREGGE